MSLRVVVLVAIVSSVVGSLAATDVSLGEDPICARAYERALDVGYAEMSLDDLEALRLCYFTPADLLKLIDRIVETLVVRFDARSPAYLLNGRHVLYGVSHRATPLKAARRNLHPDVLRHITRDSAVHAHEYFPQPQDELPWRTDFLANRSESNAQIGLSKPKPIAPFEGLLTACAQNSRDLQGLNTTYIALETEEEQQAARVVLPVDNKKLGLELVAVDILRSAMDLLLAGKEKISLETAKGQGVAVDVLRAAVDVLLVGKEKICNLTAKEQQAAVIVLRAAVDVLLTGKEKAGLETTKEQSAAAFILLIGKQWLGLEKLGLETTERVAVDDLLAGMEMMIDRTELVIAAFNENDIHLLTMLTSLSCMLRSTRNGSNRRTLAVDDQAFFKRDRHMSERLLPLIDDAAPALTAMIGAGHVRAVVRLLSASGVAVEPIPSHPDPPALGLDAELDRWKLKTDTLGYLQLLRDDIELLSWIEGTSYVRRDSVPASA